MKLKPSKLSVAGLALSLAPPAFRRFKRFRNRQKAEASAKQ
jgi:hypothetical protein